MQSESRKGGVSLNPFTVCTHRAILLIYNNHFPISPEYLYEIVDLKAVFVVFFVVLVGPPRSARTAAHTVAGV